MTDVSTFKNSDLITIAIELYNSRLYSISSIEALKSICFTHFVFTKMVMCKKSRFYAEASAATPFYVIM